MKNEYTNKCYKCKHKGNVAGSANSTCLKYGVKAEGNEHGIRNGWFFFPISYDPVWLISCDSFEQK